ncbi:MAG: ATP-binding protein, partial [Spirochaetales bacterium]|nr:ATP-binding protein [Spirochaetales bacterium]
EIQRVLMNLALNARDAIKDDGVIVFETLNCPEKSNIETISGTSTLDSSFLCVRVSDTGHGIPEEIASRIFEPFFSTKDQGEGSGLGLSAVYGSLIEHQGYINLESNSEKGTVFSLYYPLAL